MADSFLIPHPRPLLEARIVERPNRFIVVADLAGHVVRAHCPVSGRIGGLTLNGLSCLLSGPYEGRGTGYTVEAIALEPETSPTFQWIGVNQTRCNAVVESLLKANALSTAFPVSDPSEVRREKTLGASRIDFLVNDATFIEVKMPLLSIHAVTPATVPVKTFPQANPSERLPKQMRDMTAAIATGLRGAMLVVFQYENTKGTTFEDHLHSNIFPDEALLQAKQAGLEQWVCTLAFTRAHLAFRALKQV